MTTTLEPLQGVSEYRKLAAWKDAWVKEGEQIGSASLPPPCEQDLFVRKAALAFQPTYNLPGDMEMKGTRRPHWGTQKDVSFPAPTHLVGCPLSAHFGQAPPENALCLRSSQSSELK